MKAALKGQMVAAQKKRAANGRLLKSTGRGQTEEEISATRYHLDNNTLTATD
jgi:hypothetical protein